MKSENLRSELESIFRDISAEVLEGGTRLTVNAKKEQIPAILRFLKDKGYRHLGLVSCVDWMDRGEFEMVYILSTYLAPGEEPAGSEKTDVVLKARIPREGAQLSTATGIFKNAEPYEREIHELFGVNFEGHPRLIPLFLERKYEIPPFRKDFDTRKYVKEVFDEIPPIEERTEKK